jgi:hypothetical protein
MLQGRHTSAPTKLKSVIGMPGDNDITNTRTVCAVLACDVFRAVQTLFAHRQLPSKMPLPSGLKQQRVSRCGLEMEGVIRFPVSMLIATL